MSRMLLVAILCVIPSSAIAQSSEDESSWWNPMRLFSGEEENETQSDDFFNSPSPAKESFFDMSPPTWMKPSSMKTSTQNGMTKFTAASKKFWSGTISVLNPFDKPKKPKSFALENNGYKPQAAEEPTGFRWFWESDEQPADSTINDWLSRPNPVIDGQKFID